MLLSGSGSSYLDWTCMYFPFVVLVGWVTYRYTML